MVTQLYNIKPMNIGTPFIESLTSYINRLAYLHCIKTGTLIKEIITPSLNKDYLCAIAKRGGNGFYQCSHGINGIGSQAEDFAKIMGELTGVDLINSTFLFWSDVLPTRGLIRKYKAWCPVCYEESKNNNQVPFDKLIWGLQESTICSIHNVSLEIMCDNCKKEQFYLYRNSFPGCCCYCGSWLGKTDGKRNIDTPNFSDEHYLEGLFEVQIDYINKRKSIQAQVFKDAITFYINDIFNKNITIAAKQLGFPSTTLRYWISEENRPPLNAILSICNSLNLTIKEFIEKKPVTRLTKKETLVETEGHYRKKLDHSQIKKHLIKIIENQITISIKRIAEDIGCDRRLLYLKYPEECKKIKEIYDKSIQKKKTRDLIKKSMNLI